MLGNFSRILRDSWRYFRDSWGFLGILGDALRFFEIVRGFFKTLLCFLSPAMDSLTPSRMLEDSQRFFRPTTGNESP